MSAEINQHDLKRLNILFNKLKAYPEVVQEEIENLAIDSVEDAVKLAPVDTGNLKQNIKLEPINGGIEIQSNALYSAFVEFGTRFQNAQPYFFRSVRKNVRETINRLRAKLKSL